MDYIDMVLAYYAWVQDYPDVYADNITFGGVINKLHEDAREACMFISDEDNRILSELWDTYIRPIISPLVDAKVDAEFEKARAEGRTQMVGGYEVLPMDDEIMQKFLEV